MTELEVCRSAVLGLLALFAQGSWAAFLGINETLLASSFPEMPISPQTIGWV